jgi:type IV secretory pathway VirB10-like protein
MNLKSPGNNKKVIFITIGAILIAILLVVIIFYSLSKDKQKSIIADNNIKSIFENLDTDINFFRNLNQEPEQPLVKTPEPIKIITPTVKVTNRKLPTKDIQFDEIFKGKNFNDNTTINPTDIDKFLALANKSGEIKTFKTFDELNDSYKKNKTIKTTINPHYQSKNTRASYPIDFSRVLTADRNINAILVNDIDSSLGGKVIAQIEDNIYAAHGRNILIPIGSKAIGYYQPLSKVGDTRLQIIWSRIITPKGVDININSELADQMGRSGLAGEVDTRFFDRYGMALLISTISALSQTAINADKNQAVFINTYGKELSNISAKILEEQINIKPIITINAGARILISPLDDIWFRNVDGKVEVKPLNFKGAKNEK